MTRRGAYARLALGLVAVGLLYGAPLAFGALTAGGRLSPCLRAHAGPADLVVRLAFIPGPAEIELLQGFGRYGGSGGDLHDVVLLEVPAEKRRELSHLYWIDEIAPMEPCT